MGHQRGELDELLPLRWRRVLEGLGDRLRGEKKENKHTHSTLSAGRKLQAAKHSSVGQGRLREGFLEEVHCV